MVSWASTNLSQNTIIWGPQVTIILFQKHLSLPNSSFFIFTPLCYDFVSFLQFSNISWYTLFAISNSIDPSSNIEINIIEGCNCFMELTAVQCSIQILIKLRSSFFLWLFSVFIYFSSSKYTNSHFNYLIECNFKAHQFYKWHLNTILFLQLHQQTYCLHFNFAKKIVPTALSVYYYYLPESFL